MNTTIDAATPCVACLEPALRFYGSREDYAYYECTACKTVQLAPLPTAESLRAAYARGYEDARHMQAGAENRDLAMRRQFAAMADVFTAHGIGGPVLDVGAGWGGLMRALREEGIACEGLELSEVCAAHCTKAGLPVTMGDLASTGGEGCYAALAFCCVFEHLVDHAEVLAHARRLLAPGGLLISLQPTSVFARPMGLWMRLGLRRRTLPRIHHTFCPPWHTVVFSLDGMTRLLERHGFALAEIRPAPQQRDTGLTGVAQRLLERVNRVGWRLCGRRWPLMIGHLFVFQKKPEV